MQPIEENFKKVLGSKSVAKVLITIAIIIGAGFIFSFGVLVGFHKASFERAWGDHYYENFGVQHSGFGVSDLDDSPNAHGAIGKIIKVQLPTIIVADKNNTEKVVLITTDTKIEKARTEITPVDLQLDDFVVVIGIPNNQGQVEAGLIRVIPNPTF